MVNKHSSGGMKAINFAVPAYNLNLGAYAAQINGEKTDEIFQANWDGFKCREGVTTQ